VKNIRKFVVLSLCVTIFGISNFVTPVGATAQIPNILPYHSDIYKGKKEVMIWKEILAMKLFGLPKELARLIFMTNGVHPIVTPQLSDKALD
jgi:hypothetical protein